MYRGGKNCVKSVVKYVLAGVTYVCFIYLVSWLVSVGEWPEGRGWKQSEGSSQEVTTMRTIVAYSQRKQAEMERPNPIPCDRLPTFPEVKLFNRTWSSGVEWDGWSSWQRIPNTDVMLFNAFYDIRQPQQPFVRLLATFSGRSYKEKPLLYCQTRRLHPSDMKDTGVEVVAAMPLTIWPSSWDRESIAERTAFLLSCPLTGPLEGPTVVSVVTETCEDPANAFLLTPSTNTPIRNITICVKDMNFPTDISTRLIEWIEINKILGVDKIDIYVQKVHSETEKVLKHYHSKDYIRLFHVPISHNNMSSLWQRRKDHIITYNDCLYRNLAESEFIIPLDVDEVIIPKVAKDLKELIVRLRIAGWNESSSAAIIRNAFYFDVIQEHRYKCKSDSNNNIVSESSESLLAKGAYKARCGIRPSEPVMLRHVTRSEIISPHLKYSKSITVTKNVLAAFNHYPLNGVLNTNRHWLAPIEEVQVNHYKKSCNSILVTNCNKYLESSVQDCSGHRFGQALWSAIAKAPCQTRKYNLLKV